MSANATQLPAMACSYGAPANPSVQAITDPKNGQLFAAGQNAYFVSFSEFCLLLP